jgi:hypothetical protein
VRGAFWLVSESAQAAYRGMWGMPRTPLVASACALAAARWGQAPGISGCHAPGRRTHSIAWALRRGAHGGRAAGPPSGQGLAAHGRPRAAIVECSPARTRLVRRARIGRRPRAQAGNSAAVHLGARARRPRLGWGKGGAAGARAGGGDTQGHGGPARPAASSVTGTPAVSCRHLGRGVIGGLYGKGRTHAHGIGGRDVQGSERRRRERRLDASGVAVLAWLAPPAGRPCVPAAPAGRPRKKGREREVGC